jgi:hypothetical protein
MPTVYMAFWSTILVLVVSLWRFRHFGQVLTATLTTMLTLFLSYALFTQLSVAAGLTPDPALFDPADYLAGDCLAGWRCWSCPAAG